MAIFSGATSIFEERVNDLMSCHLILAERSIGLLLKTVATTPEMTTVISKTLNQVSYADEFERCRVFYVKDEKTKLKFVLPSDKERAFTVTVCLLTEIDTGRRNFISFLKEYFADESDTASFQRFCQNVLRPFKKAGESILRNADRLEIETNDVAQAEQYFLGTHVDFSADFAKKLATEINSFKIKLSGEMFVNSEQKEECILMATALSNAVVAKNGVLIKQFWIGFKNTVKVNKISEASVRRLQKMLKDANLI